MTNFSKWPGITTYVRLTRNELLAACDWTQGADSPLSDAEKAQWATYRQALRDIMSGIAEETELDDVVWPTAPSSF